MEKFTQLGLDKKPAGKSDGKPSHDISTPQQHRTFSRTQKTAALAGTIAASLLAVFLLQTSGCSREEGRSARIIPPSPVNQPASPIPSASAPALATPLAAAQPPAPKRKAVRKRPATIAYNDPTSGVSFRYPRRYLLNTPDGAKQNTTAPDQVSMNFIQPGGVAVVSVALPKGSYPGTDLASASFSVSMNSSLTPEACGQFTLLQVAASDETALQPAKVKLGGLQLQEMEALSGPATKQADAKYYHVFANGACYEFALGLSTDSGGAEDGIMPVDREDVFRRLERILASVKIGTDVPATGEVPAVTALPASAPATAASQNVAVK